MERKLKRLQALALLLALIATVVMFGMYAKIRSLSDECRRLDSELRMNLRLGAMAAGEETPRKK
jgi:hypothetical protein